MWLRSIEVQFLLATMTANPLRGILHQDVCLLVGLGGAEVMNISGVALRLADHDYANRGRSVGFLTWIHGAKVHIFGLATLKKKKKIPHPWKALYPIAHGNRCITALEETLDATFYSFLRLMGRWNEK